jgi:hypothetical protein
MSPVEWWLLALVVVVVGLHIYVHQREKRVFKLIKTARKTNKLNNVIVNGDYVGRDSNTK